MSTDITRIIRRYLLIVGLFRLCTSLIWGINFLFLRSGGLTLFEAFLVNSIFAAFEVIFEIPTGIVADTVGRRTSILLSVVMLAIGTAVYVAAGYYQLGMGMFVVMTVFVALGFTFYSGALDAWLLDALLSAGYEAPLEDVFAQAGQVMSWALVAGTLLGGALAGIHLAAPFLARLGLLLALFPVVWTTVYDVGFTPRPLVPGRMWIEMRRIGSLSLQHGWNQPSIRLLMCSTLVLHTFFIYAWHAWQEWFQQLLGQNLPQVNGVIAACIGILMAGGAACVPWLRKRLDRRTSLYAGVVMLFSALTFAMAGANSFWLTVPLYLLSMGVFAMQGSVFSAYIHALTPSEQRATVLSFGSLMASMGSVIGHLGFGKLSTIWAYPQVFMLGGGVVLLTLPFVWLLRRRNDPEDFYPRPASPS